VLAGLWPCLRVCPQADSLRWLRHGVNDAMTKKRKNADAWAQAKKKYRLSAEQIQMAKELGMNPKKFGGLANHKQEPWKAPLPDFIEDLYLKRFRRDRPLDRDAKS